MLKYRETLCANCCTTFTFQPLEVDKKYAGILEKKWTSVIRLQKKVNYKLL